MPPSRSGAGKAPGKRPPRRKSPFSNHLFLPFVHDLVCFFSKHDIIVLLLFTGNQFAFTIWITPLVYIPYPEVQKVEQTKKRKNQGYGMVTQVGKHELLTAHQRESQIKSVNKAPIHVADTVSHQVSTICSLCSDRSVNKLLSDTNNQDTSFF